MDRGGRRTWPALDIAPRGVDWELIQAALTDFDVAAIDETAIDSWRVFFGNDRERDRAAGSLRHAFPGVALVATDVPDEDWAARSQAELRAVRVGNIIIAPPWDVPENDGSAIYVVIQPSMGFGTGHHATTRLCLAHLQTIALADAAVVDLGTGSGVLAITARRLGASRVLAIDDDPDAIQSAAENLRLNPGADVTFEVADFRGRPLGLFDVVVANLTGGLLMSAAGAIQALAGAGGRLVLSGFLESERRSVLTAFSSCTIERQSQEDGWVCVTLLRSP